MVGSHWLLSCTWAADFSPPPIQTDERCSIYSTPSYQGEVILWMHELAAHPHRWDLVCLSDRTLRQAHGLLRGLIGGEGRFRGVTALRGSTTLARSHKRRLTRNNTNFYQSRGKDCTTCAPLGNNGCGGAESIVGLKEIIKFSLISATYAVSLSLTLFQLYYHLYTCSGPSLIPKAWDHNACSNL